MSLFIVPAMFTVIDDFQQWLTRVFRRREHAHLTTPAALPSSKPAT
jgi:hypothetical protein